MKQEILAMLKACPDYLSGQMLCDYFQVSRTAVWKVMNQLKSEGYHIEAAPNRGYRLIQDTDIFQEEELQRAVRGKWAGCKVIYKKTTGSTNLDAAAMAGELPHGAVIVADEQTAGRGRRGRSWVSEAEGNIYFSLLLKPDFLPERASMVTLVMALAVAEAIENVTKLSAGIKWPNDIVIGGKKVCGILTELRAEPDLIHHIVIGVGINAHQKNFSEEALAYATSIDLETGGFLNRTELITEVWARFEALYDEFERTLDLGALREDYNVRLVSLGQEVRILDPKGEYTAVSGGIDEKGRLQVTKEDGSRESIFAGEVSVRGIYGYV
ncbi:MAG: biotin--[acetyl-CoA-carboxylase] ligase [Lachnospiraceae bacterium]|nr:biotin--[acetyl-CoA-carboxylase] ligase [Lachnospiraceae bacterium]